MTRFTATPCGIRVFGSEKVPDGTYVYLSKEKVIAVSTKEHRDFVEQFGLKEVINKPFDAVVLSNADYDALKNGDAAVLG